MAMIGELTATPLDGKARASFEANYLVVDNAGMVFETKKGNFIALRDIHLTVAKGEFVSLIGHSGCGKSTLLNLIAGCSIPPRATCCWATARSRGPARTAVWSSRTIRCCPG